MNKNKDVIETYILDEKAMLRQSLSISERIIIRFVFFILTYTVISVIWMGLELMFEGTIAKNLVDTIIAFIFSVHFVFSHKHQAYKWFLKYFKKENV